MVARDSQAIAWAEQRYGCEDHARDLLDLSITGISEMGYGGGYERTGSRICGLIGEGTRGEGSGVYRWSSRFWIALIAVEVRLVRRLRLQI